MTEATPLASEQIAQEDREAAWKYRPACYWLGDDTMEKWMAGAYDTAAPVIADFARHRIAALSATPAPSGQDASQAQGEVERLRKAGDKLAAQTRSYQRGMSGTIDLGVALNAWDKAAALPPAPGATAQDGAEADEYMSVTIDRDGNVTSHNAYDAKFDEMVDATRKIIAALQERLDRRIKCPFAAGKELRAPTPTIPAAMVEMLCRCRDQLAYYAKQHRAKTAPGGQFDQPGKGQDDTLAKARVNEALANEIDRLLAAAPKQAEQQGVEQ